MADNKYRLGENSIKALKICIKEVPIISALLMLVYTMKAIIVVLNINMLQQLFEGIQDCLDERVDHIYVFIIIGKMFLYIVMQHVINAITNIFQAYYVNKCAEKVLFKLHKEIDSIPAVCFEDSEKLDFINKVQNGADEMSGFTRNIIYIVFHDMIYMVSMLMYFISLRPLLAVVCLFVFIPNFISHIVRIKIFDKMEDLSIRPWRKKEYFEQCIVSREYYKETRLYNAVNYFKDKYLDSLEELKIIKYEACKRNGLIDIGLSITMVISYIGILIVLLDSLLKAFITVGAFAAVYAALDEFFLQMDCILQYDFGNMTSEYGKIKNYFDFLEIAKEKKSNIEEKEQIDGPICAEMENVFFAYPNGEDVLKGINISINEGETIAVVGENGSGKSTFAKVLAGIYQPKKGKYLINKVDSSNMNMNAIYTNISVVFQNFMKYQMSLRENIIFSESDNDKVNEKLEKILEEVGLEDKLFEMGLNTVLSREFGKVDLSGGEWQRVAIARAIYKKHEMLILDEPTSAIDPNDETKLYELFYKVSRAKTCIMITHRIGSAARADRIIVFKGGKIVQDGTYEELLGREGEFKRLFEAQAKWYN